MPIRGGRKGRRQQRAIARSVRARGGSEREAQRISHATVNKRFKRSSRRRKKK